MGIGELFTAFYSRYPRKRGKRSGRLKFEKLLREGWTVERLNACLDRYLVELQQLGTKPQYVRYFGTFMNNIEDYDGEEIDPPPSNNASLAQRVMAGEV